MAKKNVFYINCFTEPWIKVAKTLQEKHGYEPVYWVGYQEDGSKTMVPEVFPDAIFQEDMEAWRGVFPKTIVERVKESYVNIDFLREYASNEEQAIKMLDRLDVDRYRFNFMERQRHVRNLFRSWTACIELLKPDMVITPMLPHRVYDYCLWMLCKFYNIPFLVFNHTRFPGRYLFLDDFYSIGDLFVKDYRLALEKKSEEMVLPKDIRECYEKNKLDYATAAPAYMVTENYKNKLWNSNFKIYKHALARLFREHNNWFGEKGILKKFVSMYYKEGKDISIENSNYPLRVYLRDTRASNKYKKELLEYYESKAVKPDYSEPYVIYFLHYQPEATTSPTGDIFVDQSLCIDMLLKNLPANYKVYIKEHPHQFLAHREGHTSRLRYLYDDLLKKTRVKLISTKESSFDLIENCKAIGTVCGTVGWESIVRGKPVILFGLSWYENYDKGVLRIKDEASAKYMKVFIEGYKYDEHALLAYLEAVGKNTKLAYYYKAKYKDIVGLSEDQCVNNIIGSILDKYMSIQKG